MNKIKLDKNTVCFMHDDLICSDKDYDVIQMKIFRICMAHCYYIDNKKVECTFDVKSISELLNISQSAIKNSVESMRYKKIYPRNSKPTNAFSKIFFNVSKDEFILEFSEQMNKYIPL